MIFQYAKRRCVSRVTEKFGKHPRANKIILGKYGKKSRRRGGEVKRETSEKGSHVFVCRSLCAFIRLHSFELFGRVTELCFIAAGASPSAKKYDGTRRGESKGGEGGRQEGAALLNQIARNKICILLRAIPERESPLQLWKLPSTVATTE